MASLWIEDKIWDPQPRLWSPCLLLQPPLCSLNLSNILTSISLATPSSFLPQRFCTHYSVSLKCSFLMLCLINSSSCIRSQPKYQFLERPLPPSRLSDPFITALIALTFQIYALTCVFIGPMSISSTIINPHADRDVDALGPTVPTAQSGTSYNVMCSTDK